MDTNSSLLKSIRTMTEGVISSAPFDRTRKAQVLSIDSDSTCKIKMDGVEYPRVKVYGNISGLTINQIVRVIIPENQPSQMFVLSPIAMDKVNPTGTGSFSLNRKTDTTIGDFSHAEGNDTEASGIASHAEGFETIASGDFSHAQGKFNVEDVNNTYADIVGNGTDYTARSNAYALDWEGNGHFAGDVYVGCNADSSGGTKLAKVDHTHKIFYLETKSLSNFSMPASTSSGGYRKIETTAPVHSDYRMVIVGAYSTSKSAVRVMNCWVDDQLTGAISLEAVNSGSAISSGTNFAIYLLYIDTNYIN